MKPLLTGQDIRAHREALHLPQAELARRMGYSPSVVCDLEHDRRDISYGMFLRMTDAILAARAEREAMRERLAGLSDDA